MPSLQGHLLLSSLDESDPAFFKTVILVIQHSEEQAVGVVLNRPGNSTVGELFKNAYHGSQPVYSGGPVPGPLMAIHACKRLSDLEVLDGVWYSVKKKSLDKLVREADYPMRLFDSHSGWGPRQLEEQIEDGGWRVVPATVGDVFREKGDLWEELGEGR